MENIVVKIIDWDEYNPRKDLKYPTWFRFQHNIFEDFRFFDFAPAEIAFWVYLLCQASHRNEAGVVTVNREHAHRVARIDATVINSCLKKLQRNQVVEVRTYRGRWASVQDPYSTRRDGTLRDETGRDGTRRDEDSLCAEVEKKPVSTRVANANPRGALVTFQSSSIACELLKNVLQKTQQAWLDAYPGHEWVLQELLRANVWVNANPKRAPKDFGRFMSNWLSRAFEDYRKGIPTRRMTTSEVNAQSLKDLWDKNQKGDL